MLTLSAIVKEIDLDIYQLNILVVYDHTSGSILTHQTEVMGDQSLKLSDRLRIFLPRRYNMGEQISFRIKYTVDEKARALSLMTKEQIDSKILPYLYSYCQDNNYRSMIPLQDTPSVKQYFSALVSVKDPKDHGTPFKRMAQYSEKLTEYHFSLNIKIPSYLIAIVAGNLEQRKVGNQEPVDHM